MMDQWGKPLFTIPAIPFSYFGIQGLYVFNMACTIATAWLVYLTARRMGMRLPWMAAAFFLFQPIVFGNVISGLTEPINALALSAVCWFFISGRITAGAILASFLPFFRTEGFILLAAVLIYMIARRYWKHIPLLLVGIVFFTGLGVLMTGKLDWLLSENPYFKFEKEGVFDPGHGDLLHYVHNQRHITGIAVGALLVVALMLLAAHIVYLLNRRTPEEKSRFSFWLLAPMFLAFFGAHSYIWWKGSMGSHGLLRVFVVVAPASALLAQYALDRLLSFDIRIINKAFPIVLLALCITLAYQGNNLPPFWSSSPSQPGYPAAVNIEKAGKWMQENGLQKKVVVHQLPFLNAQMGWDAWAKPEEAKTFYLWSLDKRPGQDWLPDSCVVLWDGFHAVRDAAMPLDSMRAQKAYKEVAYFPHQDSIYDVRIFIKSR